MKKNIIKISVSIVIITVGIILIIVLKNAHTKNKMIKKSISTTEEIYITTISPIEITNNQDNKDHNISNEIENNTASSSKNIDGKKSESTSVRDSDDINDLLDGADKTTKNSSFKKKNNKSGKKNNSNTANNAEQTAKNNNGSNNNDNGSDESKQTKKKSNFEVKNSDEDKGFGPLIDG